MMKLKLDTRPGKPSTLGNWVRLENGDYLCGNVLIKYDKVKDNWRIWLWDGSKYVRVELQQRKWGYGHASQAKIGAAMAAAHQRGVFKHRKGRPR